MAVINLKNCVLEIRDGASHKMQLKIGNGNITYDEKRTIEYVMDRGIMDTVREGADVPMDVRFDIQWNHVTWINTDTQPTMEDALKQRGGASTWTSSSADPCEPYAVNIFIFDIPICNADTPETIELPDFRWESLNHDPKASQIAVTGKCNAKQAIPARGAATT